jgi:hypothetical protein
MVDGQPRKSRDPKVDGRKADVAASKNNSLHILFFSLLMCIKGLFYCP